MGKQDSNEPDYSIIVPAFNEEQLLASTLDAVKLAMRSSPYKGEIIVCDNNSSDRTAEVARRAGARVAFEPINQISRARNTGARASRGRWLIWIDADTRISDGLLRTTLDTMAAGRTVGGGSTLEMAGNPGRLVEASVRLWTAISIKFNLAAGAFLFASRESFDAVGGFSEKVYASEEIWFSRAISGWGRKRGLNFEILRDHPVVTSPRKVEWYSSATILGTMLLMTFFPFAVRSRLFCFFWYRRPAARVSDL